MEVITKMEKPRIVVLGAGYGGLMSTVQLQKSLGVNQAKITLVNKNDYHYQSTWLHEVAAGTLHHDRTRIDITDAVNMNQVNFIQDTVVSTAAEQKNVVMENEEVAYDILDVGRGFEAATLGVPGREQHPFIIGD